MKFNYRARTKKGEVQAGVIEASSKEAALVLLQRHGLMVTFLQESEKVPFYAKKVTFFQRVSKKDLVNFSRQLSLMFASQITLIEALHTLAVQTRNSAFREKITAIVQEVEGGTLFSQALARFPEVFPPLYISVIKSSEVSGTLREGLDYLADYLEREYFLLGKIKGAMLYPAFVLLVMAGILILMVYFVIPQISTIFEAADQQLPLLTRSVLAFSAFVQKLGWLMALFLTGAGIFFYKYVIKTPSRRRAWDKFILQVPLLSSSLKMIYVSRFSDNLSTLIRSGLPISKALEVTSDVVGNHIYREAVLKIREGVKRGSKISAQMKEQPDLFPPILTQMVMVGERTGTLDQTLLRVVKFYQKEVDRKIEGLLSILEPALVLFLGMIVAIIVAAILMPIYTMASL